MTSEIESFGACFDHLFSRTMGQALRILGDRAKAEDVAAEACARAFADWDRIKDLTYRDAWALRVASNLAIDVARRDSRRSPLKSGDESGSDESSTLRLALVAALRKLPRRQRESVALRYLAGLPEAEVGQVLGIGAETVKTHVKRGLASLRALLGEDFTEETSYV
jgi:RNA polymerase sigma factor (sigma-70 family)